MKSMQYNRISSFRQLNFCAQVTILKTARAAVKESCSEIARNLVENWTEIALETIGDSNVQFS